MESNQNPIALLKQEFPRVSSMHFPTQSVWIYGPSSSRYNLPTPDGKGVFVRAEATKMIQDVFHSRLDSLVDGTHVDIWGGDVTDDLREVMLRRPDGSIARHIKRTSCGAFEEVQR